MMVRREGNRVWLGGAKQLFHRHFEEKESGRTVPWAERSDTYMYLTQMRAAGYDVDYATLNTVGGYGPSFAYAPRPNDKWGMHYHPPAGRDERIAHATGCRYRWRQYRDPEDYWQALKAAIDAGQIVHGPNEEDLLFIGYVDAERSEERKVLPLAIVFVDEDEWTWAQFTRWHARGMVSGWLGRIEARVEPWPARQSAIEVMKMMIRAGFGEDSRRRPDDGVVWGVAGIEAYAADLADLDKSGAPEGEGGFFQGGWRGCHNVYPQISGRPSSAAYLRTAAPQFEGETRQHIESAAEAYARATESWRACHAQLGRDGERAVNLSHSEAWSDPVCRKAGAAAVAEAARHERNALAALERALASRNIQLPPSRFGQTSEDVVINARAAAAYEQIINEVASHEFCENRALYPQPHALLTAMLIAMRAAGMDRDRIDFDTLAAVSGVSAYLAYEPGQFMPKYGIQNISAYRRVAEATGFATEWVACPTKADAWDAIKQTIDDGKVAIAPWYEDWVFAGYHDADQPSARKVYVLYDGAGSRMGWIAWDEGLEEWWATVKEWGATGFRRLTKMTAVESADSVARRVIGDLVAWSEAGPTEAAKRFPNAAFGIAGVERYAEVLDDLQNYPDHAPCHEINPQWSVRGSTANYLRSVADQKLFGPEPTAHIAAAAALYRRAYESWRTAFGLVSHGAPSGAAKDPTRRAKAAALVREAAEHERAAIAELDVALNLMPAEAAAAFELTEPRIIEHGPYRIVGMYAVAEDDEEPWGEAAAAFAARRDEIANRVGDAEIGFLYRPHRDDPAIAADVRACFMGVEVADFRNVPAGMATTRFGGGEFITTEVHGGTQMGAAMGVGDAVQMLMKWAAGHGYTEGDSCFCFSQESAIGPPFVQHVHLKLEPRS